MYVHVTLWGDLYAAIYHACDGLTTRLLSISVQVWFATGDNFLNKRINFGIHARLAQSVERWTLNPTVVGPSPMLDEFLSFNFSLAPKI